jgi:2',3'-cyclic-nucleotide 2'-phosphodiesterase (5'-nucleotidase family)
MNAFKAFPLLLCMFSACAGHSTVVRIEQQQYEVRLEEQDGVAAGTEQVILPYRTAIESEQERVIGYSVAALEKGKPESLLGNYVADACLAEVRALHRDGGPSIDFCFLNNGCLRRSLPEGALKIRHLFGLLPFGNELVLLSFRGPTLDDLLAWIAAEGGVPVAGLTMSIRAGRPAGVQIGGLRLEPGREYTAVTSSFLANGGGGLPFLSGIPHSFTGLKARDAVIRHTRSLHAAGRLISPSPDQRIQYD